MTKACDHCSFRVQSNVPIGKPIQYVLQRHDFLWWMEIIKVSRYAPNDAALSFMSTRGPYLFVCTSCIVGSNPAVAKLVLILLQRLVMPTTGLYLLILIFHVVYSSMISLP